MTQRLSRKAEGYIASLNTALSAGRFHEVPELSRKVRKHSEGSLTFARCAELQALLMQRLNKYQKTIDDSNFNDNKNQFYWLNASEAMLRDEKVLLDEAFANTSAASSHDLEYAKAVKLFFLVVSRQLNAAEQLAASHQIRPQNPSSIQVVALAGICKELSGRPSDAREEYARANSAVLASNAGNSTWHEHILYRLAILTRDDDAFNAFLQFSQEHHSSAGKRLHVLSSRASSAAYGKELFYNTHFPAADSTNLRLLDYVTKVMDPWLETGRDALQAEGLLDMLFDAASKTFHSPRILRYIFYTLAALERYEESLLALHAYFQIAHHALMTRPGADVDAISDVVGTTSFAVMSVLPNLAKVASAHEQSEKLRGSVIKTLRADQYSEDHIVAKILSLEGQLDMLDFRGGFDLNAINRAIVNFDKAIEIFALPSTFIELSLAHAQNGDLTSATTAIYSALAIDKQNTRANRCFANLLCCEELFERADVVLQQTVSLRASQNTNFEEKKQLFACHLLRLKVLEKLEGPQVAINNASNLLTIYISLFGEAAHTPGPHLMTNDHRTSNGMSHNTPQIPAIQINDSPSAPLSIQPTPAVSLYASRQGSAIRLPNDRPSSAQSKTIRSASLKLMHPSLHLPHHLNLRKSASTRSLRIHHRPEMEHSNGASASSRSSSPLNHVVIPDSSTPIVLVPDVIFAQTALDHQPTAVEIQAALKKAILADVWLYIAHLSTLCGALSDALSAIEEARLLVGTTQKIIIAHVTSTLKVTPHEILTPLQLETIHSNFEIALCLDDSDIATSIAFARFLLLQPPIQVAHQTPAQHGIKPGPKGQSLARAYELVETLKLTGRGQVNPDVWSLSAEIALLRGEEERGEQELWKVVEVSDCTGVIEWSDV